MSLRRLETNRRGPRNKSFDIKFIKDAKLEKLDSNILKKKNIPEVFEEKTVTFQKRNADPQYFRETLCREFPSLQGKEFSLWRLNSTNASKETKGTLMPLPSEINNAMALSECKELKRSSLYIKLQVSEDFLQAVQVSSNLETGLPNEKRATFLDVDSQQPTASSFTALLQGNTPTPEMALPPETFDISLLNQTCLSPPGFDALGYRSPSASMTSFMADPEANIALYNQQLTVLNIPAFLIDCTQTPGKAQNTNTMDTTCSILNLNAPGFVDLQNNASNTSSLQASVQQLVSMDSDAINDQTFWHQDRHNQIAESLMTHLSIAINSDSTTQVDRLRNLLKKHLDFLVDRMDPDFGLLDILIGSKDLTMAEFRQIRLRPSTIEERNRKLLQYIIDKNKADNLIAALREDRQMHLVNYLNSDGDRHEEYRDVWPLSENELGKLMANRAALIDALDASCLSNNLFVKEVLKKRQHEIILSKPTNSEKNEALLEILLQGSINQYNQTIESLRELRHGRILSILQESGGDMESNEQELFEKEMEEEENSTGDFPEKYKSDPLLVQTIKTKAQEKMKKSCGLTILDKELFVVSEKNSEVEVYDSIKFSFSRRWNLKELISPLDIVSCDRNKCLYINDYKSHDKSREILRVDPDGKLIKNWSTGDDHGHLSVTDESNVILTVFEKNKLNEYSPDGQLIHEINLSDAGIHNPLYAIKLTNGNFMVSHGMEGRKLARVCVVDACGKLKKSFGKKAGSTTGQLNWPWNLAVDGNGFVMVLDRLNGRVLLLNSDLEFKKEILTKGNHGLHSIQRILLDESNGRLFVNYILSPNEGRILIFEF